MSIIFSGTDYETAQTASSLLALAISSLLIPAAFHAALGTTTTSDNGVLQISRGYCRNITSRIRNVYHHRLCKLTFRYLYFQLKSHSYLYEEIAIEETEAALEYATITPWWAAGLYINKFDNVDPRLVISTVLVAICAEFLVDSIDGMVAGSGISETFVGLILLPIVGNAAEVLPLFSFASDLLARHCSHCGNQG